MKKAAILGATGYTGREIASLLSRHPSLALEGCFSSRSPESEATEAKPAGSKGPEPLEPELPFDLRVEPLDWKRVARADGVFLCTPHGTSAVLARRCLELGAKVVDLSADFRLKDPAVYAQTYAHAHAAPELLGEAVYGLTEHAREDVAKGRLIANPGCYPTAVLLALKPLLAAGLVDASAPIVANCSSGVSGAGKTPSARVHFGATHENYCAYGVGTHRHTPEIHEQAGTSRIVFVPHLLPVFRGILATIYVPMAGGGTGGARANEVLACLAEAYAGERFVRVYPRGLPELDRVQHTNECHLGAADAPAPHGANNYGMVVLVSAIDNLLKGASGQALQNMNLVLGLDEAAGLA